MQSIKIILIILFLCSFSETPLKEESLEEEARKIFKELRCSVCKSQSLDDSNADIAKTMRMVIRDKLQEGEDSKEIKEFLLGRFGDNISFVNAPNILYYVVSIVLIVILMLLIAKK